MTSVAGPKRREYSEEEQRKLNYHFILLLHTLLLVYLLIHNLIIPVISNILREKHILESVHYWFLFQIPVQYWLRKHKLIPIGYLWFLIVGSILRIGLEPFFTSNIKTWSFFSMLLSEVASFVFYSVAFKFTQKKMWPWLPLAALVIIPGLRVLEYEPHQTVFSQKKTVTKKVISSSFGCQGSHLELKLPLIHSGSVPALKVTSCGFEKNHISPDSNFIIKNTLKHSVNLRLYQLERTGDIIRWKFVRLVQVQPSGDWKVGPLLQPTNMYLVKSPERKTLGSLILLPQMPQDFALQSGRLNFEIDSLEWIHE